MRNTLTRIGAFLAGLFAGAPPPKRSTIIARQSLSELNNPMVKKTRYKTGGPNWFKIALNSQKRR